MVDQHEAAPLCPQKDSKENSSNAAPPFPLRFLIPLFSPKEPLNRSRNPIPIWRKFQIFRLHLTDYFGPFNFRIRAFVNYKVVALKLFFQPSLNHLDWTSEPKVMLKILNDMQAGILIRIGLGFVQISFDSLLQLDLNLIRLVFSLNSCLAGCKLT